MNKSLNKAHMRSWILRFALCVGVGSSMIVGPTGFAADAPTGESPLQVRNAVGTVLLAGLVGGVLGLSTLSFYANPEDNIRNIYFGAGAGMIIATLWMTLNVATSPIPNIDSPTAYQFHPWVGENNQYGLAFMHRF